MSVTLQIKAEALDEALAEVQKLGGAVAGKDVKTIMGRAAANVLRAHFSKLANDQAHHKTASALGATRTGVYEEAARGVQQPVVASESVSVGINQVAIAQRYFGGTIEPVNGKFLAIPARTETYGKRPREFDNLRFVLFRGTGSAALVQGGGKAGDALVYFWLVTQVTQQPDPSVLPTEPELIDPMLSNAQRYIDRIWNERRAA